MSKSSPKRRAVVGSTSVAICEILGGGFAP